MCVKQDSNLGPLMKSSGLKPCRVFRVSRKIVWQMFFSPCNWVVSNLTSLRKEVKGGSNSEESQESSVVHDDGDEKSSDKCDVTKNKKVSPPRTPSSKRKKVYLKIYPKKKKLGRQPRDIEEVVEYFIERGIPDPVRPKAEKFHDFYETNGWVQGKNKPIRNWHSCLTYWLCDERCPADWKPQKQATASVKLKDVLQWMQDEHPEYYEKFKDVKKLNEIDGYYIDEFRGA